MGSPFSLWELLEESARLLYKEWFVRLRFPGYEHTRIINGVLARRGAFRHAGVPEGWEKKTVGEVCASVDDGDWIESKDQGGEDYRLIQISNIGINEFVETGNMRFISEETFRRLRCREIIPNDILVSRMPTPIGRAWQVTPLPWKIIAAVDVAILKSNLEMLDPGFLLYHLNSDTILRISEGLSAGATRPRITKRNLMSIPILLPPRDAITRFAQFAQSIVEIKQNLYRQNSLLQQGREILLPRLMSGEVEVPEK